MQPEVFANSGIDPLLSFRLRLRDRSDKPIELLYRPHISDLRWSESGKRVPLRPVGGEYSLNPRRKWPIAEAVSPDNPGRKRLPIRALKIQMGLKCNLRCGYCNQTARPGDAHGNPTLARSFLDGLPRWFTPPQGGAGFRIELWGGEPFIYWKTLRLLGDELRRRYPQAPLGIVTNGSVLDDDKIAWLAAKEVLVTVSHDGPGQLPNRGADPFDGAKSAAALRKLHAVLHPKGLINFNCVLARNNLSLAAIRRHIAERLGCPPGEVALATEEFVLPYEEEGLALSLRNEAETAVFRQILAREIADGDALDVLSVREKLGDFYSSLARGRPSWTLTQRCGMDREDTLAVDLRGNVLTCQNTAADEGHGIGHVNDLGGVRLNTSRHWMTREECLCCPVIQLCKGGCMRLQGRQWEQACKNSYAFNLAMLNAAVGMLVGRTPFKTERDA